MPKPRQLSSSEVALGIKGCAAKAREIANDPDTELHVFIPGIGCRPVKAVQLDEDLFVRLVIQFMPGDAGRAVKL